VWNRGGFVNWTPLLILSPLIVFGVLWAYGCTIPDPEEKDEKKDGRRMMRRLDSFFLD